MRIKKCSKIMKGSTQSNACSICLSVAKITISLANCNNFVDGHDVA